MGERGGVVVTEFFSFILSPHGAALFVLFWIMKAMAGLWLAGKAILLLPERMRHRPQRWLQAVTPRLARHGRQKMDVETMRHDT